MSWVEKAIARENEIIRIIDAFKESGLEFVLVGGYAVSAFGRHRFSVDCDIVISKASLPKFENTLSAEGYKKKVQRKGFDKVYGGEFVSFSKKVGDFPVTVDLLVGSLASRQTEGVWSYGLIKKNSLLTNVVGIATSTEVMIPKKELLVAFKIHSGRETDLRDIVILSKEVDVNTVKEYVQTGDRLKLREQIRRELILLEDPRFVPSLKGVFTMRGDVSKDISRTKEFLEKLVKSEEMQRYDKD